MNRSKIKARGGRRKKESSGDSKLISLHRRYFSPTAPLAPDQGEQYSLEQPFPFPSVPTVTTTSAFHGKS